MWVRPEETQPRWSCNKEPISPWATAGWGECSARRHHGSRPRMVPASQLRVPLLALQSSTDHRARRGCAPAARWTPVRIRAVQIGWWTSYDRFGSHTRKVPALPHPRISRRVRHPPAEDLGDLAVLQRANRLRDSSTKLTIPLCQKLILAGNPGGGSLAIKGEIMFESRRRAKLRLIAAN